MFEKIYLSSQKEYILRSRHILVLSNEVLFVSESAMISEAVAEMVV